MADQTTSDLLVAAEPAAVMAVIADFDSYPCWAAGVRETEVLSTGADGRAERVRFVLDASPLHDEYVLAYDWEGDRAVRWSLDRAGLLKAMDGAYELSPHGGGGTMVTYRLAVEVTVPLIGLLRRKAEKVIIDAALQGLRQRVEGRAG